MMKSRTKGKFLLAMVYIAIHIQNINLKLSHFRSKECMRIHINHIYLFLGYNLMYNVVHLNAPWKAVKMHN